MIRHMWHPLAYLIWLNMYANTLMLTRMGQTWVKDGYPEDDRRVIEERSEVLEDHLVPSTDGAFQPLFGLGEVPLTDEGGKQRPLDRDEEGHEQEPDVEESEGAVVGVPGEQSLSHLGHIELSCVIRGLRPAATLILPPLVMYTTKVSRQAPSRMIWRTLKTNGTMNIKNRRAGLPRISIDRKLNSRAGKPKINLSRAPSNISAVPPSTPKKKSFRSKAQSELLLSLHSFSTIFFSRELYTQVFPIEVQAGEGPCYQSPNERQEEPDSVNEPACVSLVYPAHSAGRS